MNSSDSSSSSSVSAYRTNPTVKLIDTIFLVAGSGLGTIGNALILLAVAKFKQLHSPTFLIVGNIAIADAVVCAYVMPMCLANRLASRGLSSTAVCIVNGSVLFVCAGVSNFSFMLVAISRCMCVMRQQLYRRLFTSKRIFAYCSTIWVMWVLYAVVVIQFNGFGYIEEAFLCFYYDNVSDFSVSFLLTLLGVGCPSMIAAVCYVVLFGKLRSMRRLSDSSSSQLSAKAEMRALAPVIVAFAVFNACWGPYSIHVYIDYFVSPIGEEAHKIIIWFAVFNSAMNPIIYGVVNHQFRSAYTRLMRRATCRVNVIASELSMSVQQ